MSDEEQLDTDVAESAEPAQPDANVAEKAEPSTHKGHLSQDEWEAAGHDPNEWRSPEVFEEHGKYIKEIQALKREASTARQETDVQIRNLNQLHKVQLDNTIANLETQRNSAIEDADTAQANQIQDRIDTARQAQLYTQQTQQQPAQTSKDPAVMEWETKNPWIMNPSDPKTPYAAQQFVSYQNQGYSIDQALGLVQNDVAREFPTVNHARNTTSTGEAPNGPGGNRSSKSSKVEWKDLSKQEQTIYDSMPEAWGTQADYLKAVSNDRKGA